ncbi:hypothetical protein DRQ33_02075 [bacterium]|nr:MAG: hypothetical protein DRQ33_02075 [bacterium]
MVVSAISDEEDHWIKIAGVGTKLSELLFGSGRMFSVWQRILLYSNGWSLGLFPMPGGMTVVELPEGKNIPEAVKELQDVSQALMGVAK